MTDGTYNQAKANFEAKNGKKFTEYDPLDYPRFTSELDDVVVKYLDHDKIIIDKDYYSKVVQYPVIRTKSRAGAGPTM